MANFHVPLSDELYRELRQAAVRHKRPATALAREAIRDWIEKQNKAARTAAIAAFAARHADTSLDLDRSLERAGLEVLRRHEDRW